MATGLAAETDLIESESGIKVIERKGKVKLKLSLSGEYMSRCPVDQTNDYGRFRIKYRPHHHVAETASVRDYFKAFAKQEILNEDLIEKVALDFFDAVRPDWVEVTLLVTPGHGGIKFRLDARLEK